MTIDERGLTKVPWLTWILAGLALTYALSRAFPAAGQDAATLERQAWIHANAKECCPHDRCFAVKAAPGAWNRWDVEGYRSAVPLGGERRWPYRETFGCAYAGSPDVIRCLFVPTPEQS